jgi:hypothetical protein
MGLLATASVAIDGSRFKAVNNPDKNYTRAKVERRRADRQEPTEALAAKVTRLNEKLTKLKEEMSKLAVYEWQMLASPRSADLPDRSRQPFDGDERRIARTIGFEFRRLVRVVFKAARFRGFGSLPRHATNFRPIGPQFPAPLMPDHDRRPLR